LKDILDERQYQYCAYDAKLFAAAARSGKDAALDDNLALMKRNLLKRETEAALGSMHAKNVAQEEAADVARAQNKSLIRTMQDQGAFDVPKPVVAACFRDGESTHSEQRASKSQRTSHRDSSVLHGGSSNPSPALAFSGSVTPISAFPPTASRALSSSSSAAPAFCLDASADHEQATLMRIAAIAKQNKLKKHQLQEAHSIPPS
jgi:hypothetical protein